MPPQPQHGDALRGNVFNVDQARADGHSEVEIAQFLKDHPHLIRSDDPLFTGKGMMQQSQQQSQQEAQQRLRDIILKGPESQGQEMMAHIGGHEHAPLNEQEALQQLEDTTKRYAGGEAALYGMGLGGGSTVGQQALRGAMAGAAVRAGSDLYEGRTPEVGRTLKAAAGGALLGPVAEHYGPAILGGAKGKLLRAVLGGAERDTPEAIAAAAEPKAAAVVDAQAPQGDVEARARAAGLWTPRSSAAETGMWHAGQGTAPNPAVQTPENVSLFEKIRRGEGMPTPRTESPAYTPRPAAPAFKQGEGTSAVNLVEGEAPRVNPAQQTQSAAWDRQRLADIIKNKAATPEDIAYAKKALESYGGGAGGSW